MPDLRTSILSIRIFFVLLTTVGLFISGLPEAYAMPPHPDLLNAWRAGKSPIPRFAVDPGVFKAKGVNQPLGKAHGARPVGLQSAPQAGPTGDFRALAILVDFSDNASSVAAPSFDTLLFEATGPSLRHYYSEVSYGVLTIVTLNPPSALGWQRADETYAYYVNSDYGWGAYPQNSQGLCEELVAAVDSVVDFSDYDNDGDGTVDAVFIVHAGSGAEFTDSEDDIWSHMWSLPGIGYLTDDGVYVDPYSIQPEYWLSAGDMTIGVYCHELGHIFGLPDLYDRDGSSRGVGKWSLMAGGSWNGPWPGGGSPAHPDAWCRIQLGYASATVVPSDAVGITISAVENASDIYYLWNDGQANIEYFLVENRQAVGYDAALPSTGLCIWHVDETYIGFFDQNDNECPDHDNCNCTSHYLVALEQADGDMDLEWGANSGDSGDPFPGSTNNRTLNALSTPNSGSNADCSSYVSVTNISDSGLTMTADMGVNQPPIISRTPSSLNNSCEEGDDAVSQTLEIWNSGGETLSYTISDNAAWLTCDPIGGSSTGEHDTIDVDYPTLSLTAGDYSATITISAPGALNTPQTIPVTLNVIPPPPAISLDPTSLDNSCQVGDDAASQTLEIWNSGGGTLSYTISGDAAWLTCDPTGGSSTGEHYIIDVDYDTSGLSVGSYSATITIDSPEADNSPQNVPLSLTVAVPGGGGGGGGGMCFIATAAYGSPMEKEVVVLRRFRDLYLLSNRSGRAFVNWYYRHSPSLAKYISGNEIARATCRLLLMPVVWICGAMLGLPGTGGSAWLPVAGCLILLLAMRYVVRRQEG